MLLNLRDRARGRIAYHSTCRAGRLQLRLLPTSAITNGLFIVDRMCLAAKRATDWQPEGANGYQWVSLAVETHYSTRLVYGGQYVKKTGRTALPLAEFHIHRFPAFEENLQRAD